MVYIIKIFQRLPLPLNFSKKMETMMLFVPAPCWESNIIESQASVWGIRRIIRCIPWILRNFYGLKDIRLRL